MSEFNFISVPQIVICLIAVVMGSVVVISFGVYAPHFVQAFDAPVATISLAASITLLVTGIASPVVGRLLDIKTVRSVFIAGGILLSGGLLGISFSTNVPQFLLCYLLLYSCPAFRPGPVIGGNPATPFSLSVLLCWAHFCRQDTYFLCPSLLRSSDIGILAPASVWPPSFGQLSARYRLLLLV